MSGPVANVGVVHQMLFAANCKGGHHFQDVAKLNKQSRSNKVFEAIAVIAAGCAILSEIERRKLEEQVYQLSIRVKKLERNEGE